jgi:DNA-binding protein HU-beta
VNKTQLVDQLAARFGGNRKAAAHALESVVDVITRSVSTGERVVITGFGVFERQVRSAGTARNPRTGEQVSTEEKFVPRFRAGSELKDIVAGTRELPKRVAETVAWLPAAAVRAVSGRRSGRAGTREASQASPDAGEEMRAWPKKLAAEQRSTSAPSAAAPAPAKKSTARAGAAKKSATATKSPAAAKSADAKSAAGGKSAGAKSAAGGKSAAAKSAAGGTSAAARSTAGGAGPVTGAAAERSTARKTPAAAAKKSVATKSAGARTAARKSPGGAGT